MALRHLLPCSCGILIPVATHQAGERVQCECGVLVETPPLRRLRELPVEQAAIETSSAWGFRQGLFAFWLVAAGLFAGGAGWFALSIPEPPPAFDSEARSQVVEENLDRMVPAELWKLWNNFYGPQSRDGFSVVQTPQAARTLAAIEAFTTMRNRLLIAAGGAFVLGLILYAVLPNDRRPTVN